MSGEIFTSEMLSVAVDPSLPPGIILIQGADGDWWRYPLSEFEDDLREATS